MKKKGISLIVLVITIIVVIILAGAVILTLINNNVIKNANEAAFKSNVDQYRSQLNLWLSDQYTDTQGSFDKNTANYSGQEAKDNGIISFKEGDQDKFKIENGELKLVEENATEDEIAWFNGEITQGGGNEGDGDNSGDGGDNITTPTTTAVGEAETGTPLTENSSVSGRAYSYKNPVIPAGFYPVNTPDASWDIESDVPKGWNNGLVIRDSAGNEFVWVPVDGIDVRYERWGSIGIATSTSYTNTFPDKLPAGVNTEREQIYKYKGFYVARYEASNSSGTASTKKGIAVWTNITFDSATIAAEKMSTTYNYTGAKSGVVTGIQWDAIMMWLENFGINTTYRSTSWGNYADSVSPANISGYGSIKTAGYSEYWKSKNIYDLAGNATELTNDFCMENNGQMNELLKRGSAYNSTGYNSRGSHGIKVYRQYSNGAEVGFRVALFVL